MATQHYQANLLRHHIETLRKLKYRPTGGFCLFMLADAQKPLLQFAVRLGQTAFDFGLVLGATAAQPPFDLGSAGGHDEHMQGRRKGTADGERALDVDILDDALASCEPALDELIDADCIVVMDAGRVVEVGRHRDLLAAGGHYAQLVAGQLVTETPR